MFPPKTEDKSFFFDHMILHFFSESPPQEPTKINLKIASEGDYTPPTDPGTGEPAMPTVHGDCLIIPVKKDEPLTAVFSFVDDQNQEVIYFGKGKKINKL